MTSPAQVAIGIPCEDWMWMASVRALLRLVRDPHVSALLMPPTTTIASARNGIVRDFLKSATPWLLFLDSDMLPPPDVAQRLLRHDKDIVTGIYVNRGRPHGVMAGWGSEGDRWSLGELDAAHPLQPIDWCGCGCLLIRRKVLEVMADPWFEASPDDVREDMRFCHKAQEAGFQIFADTSCFVGHVGVEVLDLDYLTQSPAAVQRLTTGNVRP